MTTAIKPSTTAKPKAATKPKAALKSAPKPATLTLKAKTAYAKGEELVSDIGAFTKANAVAIGVAGKILGAGMKQIGNDTLADGKVAVATVKGDFADLKAITSPVDLVKLQSKLLGRNLGAVTAFGIKRTDAVIKLVEASALPIAHRVEVAVKTFKKAA